MIAMDGHLVLADFGLAWRLEERGDFPMSCVGTPEYSAPEVLQERPYGMEVDLWSFGVILYEMLARQVSNYSWRDLAAHINLKMSRQLPFDVFLNVPRKDRRWMECLIERVVFDDLDFRSCNISYDARDLLQKVGAQYHHQTSLSY
jgi:serine/threonine protein kinase